MVAARRKSRINEERVGSPARAHTFTKGVRDWIHGEDVDDATEVLNFLATVIPTLNAMAIADAMGVRKGTLSRWISRIEPVPLRRRLQALELLKHVVVAWDVGRGDIRDVVDAGTGGAARYLMADTIVTAGQVLIEEEELRLSRIERPDPQKAEKATSE